ncbi:MAG: hypothetical protein JWN75_1182 [Candidatus Saccharibacteria bacterium]|nr:hypothetical protein [Candidatus Saccharibacteria bacterium]
MGNLIVSIWQPSFIAAHTFVLNNGLGDQFVQFVEDTKQPYGWWIVLRIHDTTWEALKRRRSNDRPRLTVIE